MRLSASRQVMGDLVNRRAATALAWVVAARVITLNAFVSARIFLA